MYLKIENVGLKLVRALNGETGDHFVWARSNLVSYRTACELAKIATNAGDELSYSVWSFLDNVAEMWEHWGEEGFEIETIGQYGGVKFSFVD